LKPAWLRGDLVKKRCFWAQTVELGCVDSQHTSNGKKKGEGNTKNGNKYLSWAFIEAAHFAMRYCVEAKRFYERKKSRTNNVVAIKALAHKLARAYFHMLKERKPFDVTRCFA
jgi:transposase